MRKYIFTILFFAFIASNVISQQVCCPEFKLVTNNIEPCVDDSICSQSGNSQINDLAIYACKNQHQQYFVVPNLPDLTYSWTISSGTLVSTTENSAIIEWGNASQGYLQIIIASTDGNCLDTIFHKVCLSDGPTAGITYNPNPVCVNSPVNFSGETSVGATSYYWDFGDNTSSNLINPPSHIYTNPGDYIVILTVSTAVLDTANVWIYITECDCNDTAMVVVHVIDMAGIDIHTDDCRKMLCEGDTVIYCTNTTNCTELNWVANGGSIIIGQGSSCVTVVWDQLPGVNPSSVTLNANCPNTCGNSATLIVPVLYSNIPIQGQEIVCPGTSTSYSLPAISGTFYHWIISGGGNIINYDRNHNVLNVAWGNTIGSSNTVTCDYTNYPYSDCQGTSTLTVMIKPKFPLYGQNPVCTDPTTGVNYITGSNHPVNNWIFDPPTGFTNTPISNYGQQIFWNNAGIYSITAFPLISNDYCTPSATINVIVNPTPVLDPIDGETIICPNQMYDYSVISNLTGGNFTWSVTPADGVIIAPYGENNSLASIIFPGTWSWNLQVEQSVNDCDGSTSINIQSLDPPPATISISPTLPVCSGTEITASVTGAVPPGGYIWSSTPGAVLTNGQGNTSATFIVNDDADITISNCMSSSTTQVNITSATVSIATLGTCSATLTATPNPSSLGSYTYIWFNNGTVINGETDPTYVVTQNGSYLVQATSAGVCIATNAIIVDNIIQVIAYITSTGSLCESNGVEIQAGIPANCPNPTYEWFKDGVSILTTPSPIYNATATATGSYYVTIICANGCSSDASNIIVVKSCESDCINVFGTDCPLDLTILGNDDCDNSIDLSLSAAPVGCTPESTVWNYGDGTPVGTSGSHLYTYVGNYVVCAQITCTNGDVHCGCENVTVPMINSFTYVISCGSNGREIHLQDASMYLFDYSGYSIAWSTNCGTFDDINAPDPILTVPFGALCSPTCTLTISKNGCTLNKSISIDLPTTALSIVGSSPVCKGVEMEFKSAYTNGIIISHLWNFGDNPDNTTGADNPIQHAYDGNPTNPELSLDIIDQYGCTLSATKPITVIIPTPLAITPSPLVQICPDCLPPDSLHTNPTTGFNDYQWYQNGSMIPLATDSIYQLCDFNASGNYFVTANSSNNNCPVTSDTVQVVYHPKPVAKILGQTVQCEVSPGPYNLQFYAVAVNDYTYSWEASGDGQVSIVGPNNSTNPFVTVSLSQLGTYELILTVTDGNTGCEAKDTFCVYVFEQVFVTINSPAGILCEGTPYTFTANATPANSNYIYLWNNGVSDPVMTTSKAGIYSVTVTNPENGCFGVASTEVIYKRPYVDLFPLGCDTLCDTVKLIPPLPLLSDQTYNNLYTIEWYVDDDYNSTGSVLDLILLDLGLHEIYIVVTNNDGCSSTSGKYDLYIIDCDTCNCDSSHWEKITLYAKGGGKSEILDCGQGGVLVCNQPYSINATFHCLDIDCTSKVTFNLQPPSGPTVIGDAPLIFTPTITGTYVITLYGWCDNEICDSCVFVFKTDCPIDPCDCENSDWGKIILKTKGGDKPEILDCDQEIQIECNQPYTLNATYLCNDILCTSNVTFNLQPPSGPTITGDAPLNFIPTITGTYVLTLYGWCDDEICDSCVIVFKTDCPCCIYEISVITHEPDYDPHGKFTILKSNFEISIPDTINITEVRANVISYTITDNYNTECMRCVNFPFTWASVSDATDISTASPKITMYGFETVPPFNGSGPAKYQNPREIIWNNGSNINVPNILNIGMNFILPPIPAPECCQLEGKICVKFIFRDNDCEECEVISCFKFQIKKQ